MDTKFLNDGRKVAVLQDLKDGNYVVQEIFVNAQGGEKPAGVPFIGKNLIDNFDEEAYKDSFKDKALEKLEQRVAYEKKQLNNALEDIHILRKKASEQANILKEKISYFLQANADGAIKEEALILLNKYLGGEIFYVVYDNGYSYKISTLEEYEAYIGAIDGQPYLKLISLAGNSKGDLLYRVHAYPDGSGRPPAKWLLWLFSTLEEAKEKILELIEEGKQLSINKIRTLLEYDLPINQTLLNEFFLVRINNMEIDIARSIQSITRLNMTIEKYKMTIEKYKEVLNDHSLLKDILEDLN